MEKEENFPDYCKFKKLEKKRNPKSYNCLVVWDLCEKIELFTDGSYILSENPSILLQNYLFRSKKFAKNVQKLFKIHIQSFFHGSLRLQN